MILTLKQAISMHVSYPSPPKKKITPQSQTMVFFTTTKKSVKQLYHLFKGLSKRIGKFSIAFFCGGGYELQVGNGLVLRYSSK